MPDMTFKETLRARLIEERHDVVTYEALAREAAERGCHRAAHFIRIIAEEEKTHAQFFDEYLKGYEDGGER